MMLVLRAGLSATRPPVLSPSLLPCAKSSSFSPHVAVLCPHRQPFLALLLLSSLFVIAVLPSTLPALFTFSLCPSFL